SGTWIQELWTTGAGISSAAKVKSLGSMFSPIGEISYAISVDTKLFFVAKLSPDGYQLWISDGTGSGTIPLCTHSNIYAFAEFNNELYFSVQSHTDSTRNGIWKSDGTTGGTVLLKNMQTRYK